MKYSVVGVVAKSVVLIVVLEHAVISRHDRRTEEVNGCFIFYELMRLRNIRNESRIPY